MSPVEARLWYHLRDRRLCGVKFNRGTPHNAFIVDFVARSLKLVIEIDGDTHASRELYDERREAVLGFEGYRVLRFTNQEVMQNLEGVLQMIVAALPHGPSPRPSPRRGEGEEGSCS
jgi:very-short-patch-repair endonuclease